MKKIIAMMCVALFLFGGTYAMASTSFSEPQTLEKSKKKDKGGEKVKSTDKKTDNKQDSSKDKNTKEGNKKDSGKSDTSKK